MAMPTMKKKYVTVGVESYFRWVVTERYSDDTHLYQEIQSCIKSHI